MSDWLPDLDPSLPTPLYEQIIESVAIAVAIGELNPGDRLPSVRTLASRLRLNPNTTARSLKELERSGLAQAERGVGMRIAEAAPQIAPDLARGLLERELAAVVTTGRRLRLDRETLFEALGRAWQHSLGKEEA